MRVKTSAWCRSPEPTADAVEAADPAAGAPTPVTPATRPLGARRIRVGTGHVLQHMFNESVATSVLPDMSCISPAAQSIWRVVRFACPQPVLRERCLEPRPIEIPAHVPARPCYDVQHVCPESWTGLAGGTPVRVDTGAPGDRLRGTICYQKAA